MSSVPSPLIHNDDNTSTTESTKPKRLPRSAKKRLRFERIRQQRKQAPKKKKKRPSSTVLPTDSSEILTDQTISLTGKLFKRTANERLAEINRESTAPIICIDCAYNESMSSKEIASLARQIGRCYSSNRRSEKPVRLTLTNWSNNSPLAQECLRVNRGFENYQLILNDKPIHESYPSERLIYLSPNGEKPLTDIDEQNIYVIGGLVDESVRKNMTYQVCQDKNITCCRLPIEVYMEHSINGGTFNQILSINQVFDILLSYVTTKDWREALKKNIPERKGWVIKNNNSDSTDNKIETIIMSDEIDDLSFPNAVITRLMNEALGESTTISKEARAAMSRAALTFILYISTSANQYASNAKRKTVTVQDIFKSLQTNQFEMLVEPLQEALKDYQEQKGKKKDEAASKKQPIENDEDEAASEKQPIENDEDDDDNSEPSVE